MKNMWELEACRGVPLLKQTITHNMSSAYCSATKNVDTTKTSHLNVNFFLVLLQKAIANLFQKTLRII